MYLYRIHREIIARSPIEHGCKNGYEHALYAEVRIKFSSPEPVVFLVRWYWNEGLWKQPLPDARKFRTSGHACAEVTNITAHAHNGFLSLTAPLRKKFYFLSSLHWMASLGCFENTDFTWLESSDNLESKGEEINNIDSLLEGRDKFHGQENWVNQVQLSSFCITTLSETWFTQFPNPNHKTWGSFGVYGGHSVFCKRGPLSIRGLSS